MHVSLDSALGRQRRLNSVGESVLQIAPNAAAAYSLRSLTGGDPKVVRVRRGSNNVESDFTASGVSSGALLDFVTTPQIGWNSQPTFSNDSGTGSVTSQSSTATTATVSFTGTASLIRETSKPNHVLGSSGDQVIFNISVSGLDSAMTFRLRTASSNTTVASQSVSNGDNQDITLNLTGSAGYLAITAVASSGGTITFNSIQVLPKSGFVETWYDQSGNGRDSTQTTAARQPIIVESGTFQDGLKFTHTDTTNGKRMYVPRNTPELGTEFALAWVGTYSGSEAKTKVVLGNARGVQTNNSGAVAIMVRPSSNAFRFINENSGTSTLSSINTTTVAADTTAVVFANFDDDAVTISTDGNVHTSTLSGTSLTSTADLRIMAAQSASGATGGSYRTTESTEGICKEVLVYDTNQSNNRTSIETNIINHYSIS